MNIVTPLVRTAMPGLSTGQTAFRVNRFLAQRPAPKTRPALNEQRRPLERPSPGTSLSLVIRGAVLANRTLPRLPPRDRNRFGNRQSPNPTHTS